MVTSNHVISSPHPDSWLDFTNHHYKDVGSWLDSTTTRMPVPGWTPPPQDFVKLNFDAAFDSKVNVDI